MVCSRFLTKIVFLWYLLLHRRSKTITTKNDMHKKYFLLKIYNKSAGICYKGSTLEKMKQKQKKKNNEILHNFIAFSVDVFVDAHASY